MSGCEGATRRYRCLHQAEQLRLRGLPVQVVSQSAHDIVDAGLGHGIVILHRVAWDDRVQALIDRTRDAGGFALFDIDDLVFEPESTHHHHGVSHLPPDEQALYHDGVRRYRRTLLACDGALVATRFLADRIRALGRPAWISRNCIDLEIARRSKFAAGAASIARDHDHRDDDDHHDGVVIGYASGSRTHDLDFAEAAGPAVMRIMSRRPDVRLHVVGPLELGSEWSAFQDRIVHVPAVDWQVLPSVISRFDISLAPLEIDNPFCRAKSELKWLEASACGIPSVAANTEAFRAAIHDGVTGLLASDVDGWERALESLIGDAAARKTMGAAAAAAVHGHRTTDAQAFAFERTLAEARASLRPDTVAPPAPTLGADGRPERALSVTLIVPEPPKGSGGHASIFRMIAALDKAGHVVTVHIKPGPLMQGEREAEAAAFIRTNFPRSGAQITLSPEIGPCDVVIATSWTTALDAHYAPATTKLYFVQDFEPYFQPISADYLASESTYRLGLGHITLGPWLSTLLRERYDARAVPIDFGVEHEIYGPVAGGAPIPEVAKVTDQAGNSVSQSKPRVVFYGRGSTPRRGVRLGLEALANVKAVRPDVEVVLYGGEEAGMADFSYVHAGILTQPELAALYRSATVGLALSYTNLSFVPLEMAACGLPVVAVETEPAAWYQVDGETCLVAEPTAESVAEGILRLIDDAALRQRLVEGGLRRVAELSWERSTSQFVRHVEAYARDASRESSRETSSADIEADPPALHPVLDILDDGDVIGMVEGRAAEVRLELSEAIEWTITPGVDGLHRLDVRLSVDRAASKGYVRLCVREDDEVGTLLADSIRSVHSVFDGEWNAFEFPPLAESAGRSFRARIEVGSNGHSADATDVETSPAESATADVGTASTSITQPALEPKPGCRIVITIGERGVPAHRTFGLDDVAGLSAHTAAIHDPELFERLHIRRRSLAFHRAQYARMRRRQGLVATIDIWRRWTNPMPPVPHRPWPDSASGAEKALRGVLRYGPIRVLREMAARRRWRASENSVSRAPEDVVEFVDRADLADSVGHPLILHDAPALARFAMGDDYLLAERILRDPSRPVVAWGPWVARWVEARHGVRVAAELPFPIDRTVFHPGSPTSEREPIVALDLAICRQRSNAVLGLRTLEILVRKVDGARAIVFSSSPLGTTPELGPSAWAAGVRWVGDLGPFERAELMREVTILVVPAFSNPPLEMVEAMACGCVIAAPDVISTAWLLENGRTAITVVPHADALSLGVLRVLRDRELFDRLSRGAAARIDGRTANLDTEGLSAAIARIAGRSGSGQGEPVRMLKGAKATRPSEAPESPDEDDRRANDAYGDDDRLEDSQNPLPWLALCPAEQPEARPILYALRFAEERDAALELAIEMLERSIPARAATWLSLRPGPLPSPHMRPWPQDAGTLEKLMRTIRHFGPAAFVREVREGVRWLRMSEAERRDAGR